MRKINIILLDHSDDILRNYQKSHKIKCLDEAVNKLLLHIREKLQSKGAITHGR